MFIYLSKKIAIPNSSNIMDLAWSAEHGFIACGGEHGLLKVLKLDSAGSDDESNKKRKGLTIPKNLNMNQSLEGHNGSVMAVTWNENYQKLTSSDQNGLIIVWILFKGSWYEEMINTREKAVVKGMSWTADGNKICIVYNDGAVIVGSVDGNRLWGKELKGLKLSQVEWSPDGKLILIGVLDSEIHVYDNSGNFITKVPLPVIQGYYGPSNRISSHGSSNSLIGIKWFNGTSITDGNDLAIAFENGRVQLMKNECDETPIIFDTEIKVTCITWNYYGSILAVSGIAENESANKNRVKFYNQQGDLIQVLKVQGKCITSCSWEKDGLRIAMSVDSYIFFAIIKPDYKWGYFESTIVFTTNNNSPAEESFGGVTNKVVFWNINSNTKHVKVVKNLLKIAAFGDYCVLAYKFQPDNSDVEKQDQKSTLILCNSIGTPIDTINIEHTVNHLAITNHRVIAASKQNVSIWKFNIPTSQSSVTRNLSANRKLITNISIDENQENDLYSVFMSRNDPISCICIQEKNLIIAQESGCFQQLILPNSSIVQRFNIRDLVLFNLIPARIQLNNDYSKLAIIDTLGSLFIYDFELIDSSDSSKKKLLDFERKDVWDIKWANDNNNVLAFCEKTKLIAVDAQTLELEDPIQTNNYIYQFDDLSIKTISLDELIRDESLNEESSPTILNILDYIDEFDTKVLRNAKKILEKVDIPEASKFMEQQTHPRLWKLFAQYALNALDLTTAEYAFVKCKDYKGIQFTKRINQLKSDSLKRAEIYTYFNEFDEAEKIYLDIDRRDLAIQLRRTLGDWSKVIDLLKNDLATGNDDKMRDALYNLGDFYADNYNWSEAVIYYEKCGANDKLFECYSILECYDELKQLINEFNNNNPILVEFGRTFESVGMCAEAVQAYVKAKKIDLAINCCVTMSEWKMAIDLANEYNVPNIDSLLIKYAQHLLTKGKHFDIVELYRKANRIYDAASMLLKIIDDAKNDKKADPLLLKKLYTLIGLLYEEHRLSTNKINRKISTLNSLLNEDSFTNAAVDFKSLDDPWKGAEAYHFLILCQRQLYEGYFDAAMKTAMHLRDYDDLISTEEVYCLLALASCANRSFSICSKAFIKLESCESIPEERRQIYSDLAINIFTKNPPKDSRNSTKSECTYCETMISDWCTVCPSCHMKFPICIASGRPLMDSAQQWTCNRCNHHAYKSDVITFSNCPLCHKSLSPN